MFLEKRWVFTNSGGREREVRPCVELCMVGVVSAHTGFGELYNLRDKENCMNSFIC